MIPGLLRPFYQFEEGNQGYSAARGLTKAYRLQPEAWGALDAVYSGVGPLPALVGLGDGTTLPFEQFPSAGVPEPLAMQLPLPKAVPASVRRVGRALATVESWAAVAGWDAPLAPDKPLGASLQDARQILLACRRWAASIGGIPNLYQLESQGRLGPVGLHVIGLPRSVRSLLFDGSGLWDYDLASCHWSIFRSLARAHGLLTPMVDSYLANKADWHSRWAAITGHPHPQSFKAVALSWLTGGGLSPSPWTSNVRRVGQDAMRVLAEDRFTRALHDEVRQGMAQVVGKALREETVDGEMAYVNAVGAVHRPQGDRGDMARRWAHALTGYEQWVIREVCSRVVGLQAIIYDGFIAPEQDVGALEQYILRRSQEEFGFSLELRLEAKPFSASAAATTSSPQRRAA